MADTILADAEGIDTDKLFRAVIRIIFVVLY
jgi:hypothetical protein